MRGALLQGDVSQDLVEDAFLNYLRKLDELARLDLVAMHLEQRDDPGQNVLHVFGRTFSQPHKYFYRCYAAGRWTSWQPVTAEIEGDHLAPVVWRGRLWLFWVTFMEKPVPGEKEIKVEPGMIVRAAPPTEVEARLNWSEYVKGEWSTRESSGFEQSDAIKLTNLKLTDINQVFVHVSREVVDGAEEGVFVHLVPRVQPGKQFTASMIRADDGSPSPPDPTEPDSGGDEEDPPSAPNPSHAPTPAAFYLAGRNSRPVGRDGQGEPANLYNAKGLRANRYVGADPLTVIFKQRITTQAGKPPAPSASPSPILDGVNGGYTLLPCDGRLALEVPESAYKGAANPEQVKAALQNSLAELESLIKPVFYQDNTHTFFIEPNVSERTVEQWKKWIPPRPPVVFDPSKLHDFQLQHVRPQFPRSGQTLPGLTPAADWLVNRTTLVRFDERIIGPDGQVPLTFEVATTAATRPGVPVRVSNAGAMDVAEVAVLGEGLTLEQVGLAPAAGDLHVIGGGGVNSALMNSLDGSRRNGSAANVGNIIR